MNSPAHAGTLTLLRHGATEWNAAHRYQGHTDIPLSDTGRAQARAAGEWARRAGLRPMRVWTSDLARARETASTAFPGATLLSDSRLRELAMGAFEGATYHENLARHGETFRAWIEDPRAYPPPGGEELSDFESRVAAWFEELAPDEDHMVVTHGGVARLVLRRLTGIPIPFRTPSPLRPGGIARIGPLRPPPETLRPRPDPRSEMPTRDPLEPVDDQPRHPDAPRPKQRIPGSYRVVPPREKRTGLVIVNTGDGKGKTTAALGLLLRARGRGMSVAMIQFIKSARHERGEHLGARTLGVEIEPLGDGFTWLSERIEEDRARARTAWERCVDVLDSGDYDIVIFDELTYALSYGWLTHEEVLPALADRPVGVHVVITGRDATPELIDFADLVTEMREIKHPYRERGVPAQPGIEL